MSNQNGDGIKKVSENLNTQCFQLHRDDQKSPSFFKYRGFFQDLKGVEFVRPRPRVFTSAVKHHVSRFHFAVVQ